MADHEIVKEILSQAQTLQDGPSEDWFPQLEKEGKKVETLEDKENKDILEMRKMWSRWILRFIGLIKDLLKSENYHSPHFMTDYQKWLSRRYIAYQVLTHMWFVSTVWLYFYRLFMTDQQVGVLDGMAFAIGLIAEVPSGALADRFGRGRMVKIGQLLVAGGILTQVCGASFSSIFIGQSIVMIGVSFTSGADEALFFDKLKFDRDSSAWRKLMTRASQFSLATFLIAAVVGGWMHTIDPRLPWIFTVITFASSSLVIWPIKDIRQQRNKQTFAAEIKEHVEGIVAGFAHFFTPRLWRYVPIIITVQGVFYAASFGMLQLVLLDRFHFSPFWGTVVVALCGVVTMGILHLSHRYAEKVSEKRALVTISIITAVSLLVAIGNIGMWGAGVVLVLYAGERVLYPFMSDVLNKHAPESQRATVLSVASFFRTLPYVVLAPIIGYLNVRGELGYFFVVWALFIVMAMVPYMMLTKHTQNSVHYR